MESQYTLGLDIGIASVGWCLLNDEHIIDLGVRTFNKAETPKGGSLNAERREKRTIRNRLKRRRQRLQQAKQLFKTHGLLASTVPEALHNDANETTTPWELRAYGLDQKLSGKQFAQALHHLVKYRGFRSMRKSEQSSNDKETGKLLTGVQSNHALLSSGKYRTPAEIAMQHEDYISHKRNKQGHYTHTFQRLDLLDELKQLFEAQRKFKNELASNDLEKKVHDLIWDQKPALSGDAILKLIGNCTFEKEEKRCPKAGYSFERFNWLQKLNHITVYEKGVKRRRLTDAEKDCLREVPYEKGGNNLTYKQLRAHLEKNIGFASDLKFTSLTYSTKPIDEVEAKASVIELKSYATIRKLYNKKEYNFQNEWQKLSCDSHKLDAIGYGLTVYKTDEEVSEYLLKNGVSQKEIDVLLTLSFQKVGHLSLKAIKKLLPYLEKGLRYDEAASAEYLDHRAIVEAKKSKLLPPINKDEIRNPIVFRGLNQARKVINAVIKKHGSPKNVHIELARELSQPFEERRKIKKEQDKYKEEKESSEKLFQEELGFESKPKGLDLLKFRLYREQDGKCAYSLNPIDLNKIMHAGYVEVDHALPYSRSYDDSLLNKVLVLTSENRNKGNKTPYEYLHGDEHSPQWRMFEAFVTSNPKYRQAKRNRLLRQQLSLEDSDEFKSRNLNDTRYIGKYLKNQIETYLELSEESTSKRCLVVQGRMTSFLRTRWGILKVRDESDLHHAIDAAVIAACSHKMVKRISDYSRLKELQQAENGFADPTTGEIIEIDKLLNLENKFPMPWPNFKDELRARLSSEPKEELPIDSNYPEALRASLQPILVSRAPQRRNTGAAHQDTIRSKKRVPEYGESTVRTPLNKLTQSKIESMVGKDDPRNEPLYRVIKERLEKFNGKGDKAFDPNQPPVFRPRQDGTFSTTIVKSIKLLTTQRSGVSVRKGIADNDSMLRVDVFQKDGKYHWTPIYVADIAKNTLPNKIVFGKSESEWKELDTSYQFCFSLSPNDFAHIKTKTQNIWGYFAGADRSTGNLNFWSHDRNKKIGKKPNEGMYRGIGIKTATSFEKYHVDILGNKYSVKGEKRHDLAKYRSNKK